MTVTVNTLPRVFRAGALEINDTNPSFTHEEAWDVAKGAFPHLQQAELSAPYMEDNRVVIEVNTPPAKSNG